MVFFLLGLLLMPLAADLSNTIVFYYGSGMLLGILLVVIVVLYQVGCWEQTGALHCVAPCTMHHASFADSCSMLPFLRADLVSNSHVRFFTTASSIAVVRSLAVHTVCHT